MKTYRLHILFVVFFLICCKENIKSKHIENSKLRVSNDTLITIIFKARTFKHDTIKGISGEYSFRSNDLFYTKEGSFIENVIPKNNFKKNDTVKIYSDKEIILNHSYYYNYYTLFKFKPGDTIVFDYPNDYPICKTSSHKLDHEGSNVITNINLKAGFVKSRSQFFIENKRLRTPLEEKKADQEYKNIISFKERCIDSLFKNKKLSSSFFDFYMKDLNYNSMDEKSISLTQDIDLSISSGRKIVLKKFDLIYKVPVVKQNNYRIIDSRIQFDNVLKTTNISTKNKDFLIYNFMVEIILNFSKSDIQKYFDLFKNSISKKEFIDELEKKYLLNKILKYSVSENLDMLNIHKNEFELSDLIKNKYKGRVVFIDFWASWCEPCRASMPASNRLKDRYKDKNIVFVYISIDSDYEKWTIASTKENLANSEDSFLATNYPIGNLYKELQLKTIPRYIIYDKKGELVHRNAPSPESEDIIEELDKYLN